MKKLREKISEWWHGSYHVFDKPNIIDEGPLRPHWTARAFRATGRYIKKHHWKIISAILVALGLWLQWYVHTHPNHPPTLSVKDEGVRSSR